MKTLKADSGFQNENGIFLTLVNEPINVIDVNAHFVTFQFLPQENETKSPYDEEIYECHIQDIY